MAQQVSVPGFPARNLRGSSNKKRDSSTGAIPGVQGEDSEAFKAVKMLGLL